jgi:hypothetical protein
MTTLTIDTSCLNNTVIARITELPVSTCEDSVTLSLISYNRLISKEITHRHANAIIANDLAQGDKGLYWYSR